MMAWFIQSFAHLTDPSRRVGNDMMKRSKRIKNKLKEKAGRGTKASHPAGFGQGLRSEFVSPISISDAGQLKPLCQQREAVCMAQDDTILGGTNSVSPGPTSRSFLSSENLTHIPHPSPVISKDAQPAESPPRGQGARLLRKTTWSLS